MANQILITYPKSFTREQIDSAECKAKVEELRKYLTNNKIEELCVHEAGHLILARRAGVEAFPVGPTIYLDKNEDFQYQASSVDVPAWSPKHALPYSEGLLANIGRGLTAGGIFLEHFEHLPEERWGDGDDWNQFTQYWQCAAQRDEDFRRMVKPEWDKARNCVRAYLRKLTVQQEKDIEHARNEVRKTLTRILNLF